MAEEKGFSMKASKFTESQIAFVLKQGDEGTPVAEISKLGSSGNHRRRSGAKPTSNRVS